MLSFFCEGDGTVEYNADISDVSIFSYSRYGDFLTVLADKHPR